MNFNMYWKRKFLALSVLCGMLLCAAIVCWGINNVHVECGGAGTVSLTSLSPQANKFDKKWRRVNSAITDYDTGFNESLHRAISAEYGANHPEVISLVRTLMDPPSHHITKPSRHIVETPQSTEIRKILKTKKNGFFVDCGAYDGEQSSNTLYLEKNFGWEGVLIEMDPYYYTQLLGKSRNSHSINACLSPTGMVSMLKFTEDTGQRGQLEDTATGHSVPCFPFESILAALNRTKVDFFSLDVEGKELEVLKTIPFDKIQIDTLAVEYLHGLSGKEAYKTFMGSKGYVTYKEIHTNQPITDLYVEDFIFAKQSLLTD